jgi:hypothetical protein
LTGFLSGSAGDIASDLAGQRRVGVVSPVHSRHGFADVIVAIGSFGGSKDSGVNCTKPAHLREPIEGDIPRALGADTEAIWLSYFIAVAKLKSFTQAATVLYVSQPTRTAQIKSLKTRFGCAC